MISSAGSQPSLSTRRRRRRTPGADLSLRGQRVKESRRCLPSREHGRTGRELLPRHPEACLHRILRARGLRGRSHLPRGGRVGEDSQQAAAPGDAQLLRQRGEAPVHRRSRRLPGGSLIPRCARLPGHKGGTAKTRRPSALGDGELRRLARWQAPRGLDGDPRPVRQ